MTKVVYVVGPSSTGKTTLCDTLAKRLGLQGSAYITEVARQVMKERGYTRADVGNIQMQIDIMESHWRKEGQAFEEGHPIILSDRSALDPLVYAKLTQPSIGGTVAELTDSSTFAKALQQYRAPSSIFLLLTPAKEWIVDDGVRSLEEQDECLKMYRDLLETYGIQYREISQDMKFIFERMVFTLGLLGC